MKAQAIVIGLLLAVVLGVPFVLSAGKTGSSHDKDLRTLIIVTPHVPQIRDEFARGFAEWHAREFNEEVSIDFRTPGGTSEIRKQLSAMFKESVKKLTSSGNWSIEEGGLLPEGTIPFDLMFGGGSYDHAQLISGVSVDVMRTKLIEGIRMGNTEDEPYTPTTKMTLQVPISRPMNFTQAELDAMFGENAIGPQELYDPNQYWIGNALSSFGIVYNRDVFNKLNLPEPTAFADLTQPALWGWIALADPRQSGSITTTFDSILGNEGWEQGWRTLRGMCGNTRYFTNSSTKPPIDVSQGEAAAGLAIDFYGRGQAQVVKDSGGGDRVGYSDPAGAVYVDADPVSIINGGPDFELATRFVRYLMTDEAQALWQFDTSLDDNPIGSDGEPMGPHWHALRRMPVKRSMYVQYFDEFVDQVDPFEIVSDVKNPGWRTGVQVMMGCFGIDIANECRGAYKALNDAIASGQFSDEELAELDALFYAFPETEIEGEMVPFTPDTFRTVRDAWRTRQAELEIEYAKFYRANYLEIMRRVRERV
jgi:ABC-type Fe3+ transport system substrate-binding protein